MTAIGTLRPAVSLRIIGWLVASHRTVVPGKSRCRTDRRPGRPPWGWRATRAVGRVSDQGRCQIWLAEAVQSQRMSWVPAGPEPASSRHLPDCGFFSVPSV